VESLDNIAANPGLAAGLTREERSTVIVQAATVLAAIAGTEPEESLGAPVEHDSLLTPEELATALGRSHWWITKNGPRLPFAVKIGREWRYSRAGLDRYIEDRRGGRG
jgi:hypothetical protein